MPKKPDHEQLDYEWKSLDERFKDFHSYRDLSGPWNKIRRRALPPIIQAELKDIQEGIEFTSPALEKAVTDWKAILKMEPTIIDARVAGVSQKSRDDERDLAIFFRRSWDIQNRGRLLDDLVGEGQIIHGQTWLRKTYKPFNLPDEKEALPPPFSFEDVLIDGMYWPGGKVSPDAPTWYRYSKSVVDSGIIKDGKRLNLDNRGAIAWMSPDEPYDYKSDPQKRVHIIVRDWPDPDEDCPLDDCDHTQRYITTYVCPEGKDMDDAEEVETVASPFATNSFYAVAGFLMQTERDPHLVYRPVLLPLYELIQWKNYLVTLLAVLVRAESKDDSYINAGEANPQTLMALLPEGERGNTGTARNPDTQTGELPLHPGPVERYPKVTSEHLVFLIKQCDEMIAEYMPNRYLTGHADVQAANATGTAVMSQTEAASVVPSALLTELDSFIDRSIRDEMHAFRYWSHFCPDDDQPRWMVSVTGSEANLRGKRAGDRVYITAKTCEADVDLIVITGNKTWAEKQAEWSLAKDQYAMGVLTVEDLIRKAGIYDVELQKELLFGARIESALEPLEDRMAQLLLTREAAIKTGIDFGQLMQVPPVNPDTSPQGQPMPQSSTPHNPSTQAAAVQHSMNPTINLPPVGQPQGGASGVAPGVA